MNQKNNLKIIFGNKTSNSQGLIYVQEQDFEIPHGDDYKIAIAELNKINNFILNNKPFLENFLYSETSLWWFIYPSLIGKYKQIVNFILEFSKFLDTMKPDVVEVHNLNKLKIIQEICKQKDIQCISSKTNIIKFQIQQKSKNKIKKKRFDYITNKKIDYRKKLYRKKSQNMPDLKNKIIFAVPTIYRRQIFDVTKGVTKEGEYIQESIMNFFKEEDLIGLDLDYTFKGNFQILSNRLDELIHWFPIEMLMFPKQSMQIKQFLNTYKKIISSKQFQDNFSFNGISLWNEIKEIFNEMLNAPHLPFYLNLIDSLSKIFQKNKPRAIFLPYETGPLALSIIAACRKNNIKTIGIQHGYIYQFNPMYCYPNSLESKLKHGFLLPDHLLLFGNNAKKLLLKNEYPKQKLIEFGNAAFFGLEKFFEIFEKTSILQKIGINEKQKIILFTTGKLQKNYQAHGKYDYDEKIWNYLLNTYGNNKNYFLILKPHPQEQNTTIYENMMSKKNCSNAIITHQSIYDLICISDIVLSVFSSTMIDSLCFRKPVIMVQFGDTKHPIFDSADIIIKSNLENLSRHINDIIDNKDSKLDFHKEILNFVKDHYGIPESNPKLILNEILNEN